MNDYEKEILNKTKEYKKIPLAEFEELENREMPEEDRAALKAVLALRASLGEENKDKEPQALWRFIRYITEIEMPLQIIDYSGLLFPENEDYYAKALTPTAFQMIQRQATLMIANKSYENEEHKAWLENISNGKLPYGYSVRVVKKEEEQK